MLETTASTTTARTGHGPARLGRRSLRRVAGRLAGLAVVASALGLLAGCAGYQITISEAPRPERIEYRPVLEETAGYDDGALVALVAVDGMIADAPQGLIFTSENPVGRLDALLRRVGDDEDVKAVILRVNSRGGTVVASRMMYDMVVRFREETGKPVVVLMGEVAASGGFYLACAGDHVMAHPATITGSIGVIFQTIYADEGLRKLGITAEAITSGPNKSMGSPLEPRDPEHVAILQALVDEHYAAFRDVVRTRRPDIEDEAFDAMTDGRIVTGRQAVAAGLIDATGDIHDALAKARELGGSPTATLVRVQRDGERSAGLYASGGARASGPGANAGGANGASGDGPAAAVEINLLRLDGMEAFVPRAGFYYIWDPRS